MPMEGNAVVIVGMPRSGTSSVAGALSRLGVYFGDDSDLYGADEQNAGGYWEHRAINAVNRRFHLSMNLPALDVDPLPNDWRERPMTPAIVRSASELLEKQFSNRMFWAWKDPQAATLLPFVREVFKSVGISPAVVICVRNPSDVAASQLKRQGTPFAQTVGAWVLSTLSALRDSRGMMRHLVLYNRYLNDPSRVLAPIVDNISLVPSEAEWKAATDFVRPELSHGVEEMERLYGLPSIVRETYEMCLQISEDANSLESGRFDERIDTLWSDWSVMHSMFSRSSLQEATFGLAWDANRKQVVRKLVYRPTKGWQKLNLTIGPPPKSRVSILLYPLPAVVWIRKALWRQAGMETAAKLVKGLHGQLDRHGEYDRVWLFHGYEQVAVVAPASREEAELELEVLIDANNVIAGMTFQDLSQRAIS